MTIKGNATVTGVGDFVRALRLLNRHTQANTKGAVRASTLGVEQGAKMRVPRLTGELASTIRSEFSDEGFVGTVKVGFGKLRRSSRGSGKLRRRVRRVVTSGLGVYAMVVEYGGRHWRERPFLRPARDAERPRHIARLRAALQRATESASRGA